MRELTKPIDWLSKRKWQVLDKIDERKGIFFATDQVPQRFAYFGELGYGLMSFFPYLNYLASIRGMKIETYGPLGSSAFFYFSSNHTELPLNTVPGLGDRATIKQVFKMIGNQSFFSPRTMSPSYILSSDESLCWRGLENGRIQDHNGGYLKLSFKEKRVVSSSINELLQKNYILVNLKSHFNWNNDLIPNFYQKHEIFELIRLARKTGQYLYINDVVVTLEESEIKFEHNLKGFYRDTPNVVFLSDIYQKEKSLADKTRTQILFMQNAKHIFASQGGNAALSIINNRNVTVLMRGGFDWPDYVKLASAYSTNTEFVYEVGQSKSLLNNDL